MGMRRTVLALASTALVVLLASGVAWAVTKNCKAGADYCIGTDEPDTLNGSKVRDKMYGLGEVDLLLGSGGNDLLRGGPGNDTVKGGAGNDNIDGDDPEADAGGSDRLYGQDGNDYISDYAFDFVSLTEDQDLMSGGKGDDTLYGTHTLNGGPGDDVIGTAVSRAGTGPARTITGARAKTP
jgi:Ca2+-binding RTX toxin-like protein